MSEWIPLLATRDTTLQDLLSENGLPNDDDRQLARIWSAPENRVHFRGGMRPANQIRANETWYVPPPPLAMDAVLSQYRCTGSEASVDEIVETIKASHGEGSDEQLTVEPSRFTRDYLLGLAHNQAFRTRRDAGQAIEAGELLRYPTRRRRTRTHDVAPSTSLQRSSASLPTGGGPFTVTVELAEEGQKMKILEVTPGPKEVDPHSPTAPVTARWRPADGKVRFKVTITPVTGDVRPTRVTIRVREPNGVYFTEDKTDGEWTQNGEHTWEWDGFTIPATAGLGRVDTKILRGQLTVEVIAQAASGSSTGTLELANRAHKAAFLDASANLATQEIDFSMYVSFHHASEDGGIWLITFLSSLVAAGLALATVGIAEEAVEGEQGHELDPQQREDFDMAFGAATAGAVGLTFLVAGIVMASARLTDADFDTLKRQILEGLELHWKFHDAAPCEVDGRRYIFRPHALTSGGHDHVQYALMSALPDQRPCNLIPAFGMIVMPYTRGGEYPELDIAYNKDAGAHEFGHSVLLAITDNDSGWSMRHKGSTDLGQNTETGTNHFTVPPTGPADLMIYYDLRKDAQGHPIEGEPFDRKCGARVDIFAAIASTQIEFRKV